MVPEKPYKDPGNYNKVAQRLAQERGFFWANQFDNTANRRIHYHTTGPEIWDQTGGRVTAFVSAVGTGGTLAGTTGYLKGKNPQVAAVCADPYGAAMWSWFKNHNLETNDGDSFAEGIGQGRVTKNLEELEVDEAIGSRIRRRLPSSSSFGARRGFFSACPPASISRGAARYAKQRGPGQVVVTMLCDSGHKYIPRLYNPEWCAANGLRDDLPLESAF